MPTPRKYASNAERQAAYRMRCSGVNVKVPPPRPGYRRWDVTMRQVLTQLEAVASEMAAYYEERTEAWKDSERGESFTERLELMEETLTLLQDLP